MVGVFKMGTTVLTEPGDWGRPAEKERSYKEGRKSRGPEAAAVQNLVGRAACSMLLDSASSVLSRIGEGPQVCPAQPSVRQVSTGPSPSAQRDYVGHLGRPRALRKSEQSWCCLKCPLCEKHSFRTDLLQLHDPEKGVPTPNFSDKDKDPVHPALRHERGTLEGGEPL